MSFPYMSEQYLSPFGDTSLEYRDDAVLKPDIVTDAVACIAAMEINAKAPSSARILELGAGAAPFLALVGHRVRFLTSLDLVGVDNSPASLEFSRHNVSRALANHGNSNDTSTVACEDWTETLAGTSGFDVIYFNPPFLPLGEIIRDEYQNMPAASMFVGGNPDGLDNFRTTLPPAVDALKPGGLLFVRTPRPTGRYDSVVSLVEEGVAKPHTIHPIHIQSEMGEREGRAFAIELGEKPRLIHEIKPVQAIGLALERSAA